MVMMFVNETEADEHHHEEADEHQQEADEHTHAETGIHILLMTWELVIRCL